jgi:hypothetical protein
VKVALDKEFCAREKLNRTQLFIETIGLYLYLIGMVTELYYGSYWMLCFHMIPLLIFHASQILAATISHSGLDKRNSFNSNGMFDYDTAEGLWATSLWLCCLVGNGGPINHGIHHAFSQLPLDIINHDYKAINKYALETYQNVRYNNMLTMIIHKNILDRLPPPKWYHRIIQFFVTSFVILISVLTILGLDIPPVIWELAMVDYRTYLVSTKAERYANLCGMYEAIELHIRRDEIVNPNAYFETCYRNYVMMKA